MKFNKFGFVLITFILAATFINLPTGVVIAQDSTPSDDEVNAIARKLYCPVCENTPLDVCPTTACHQWRELIRQMIADGKSEAEIEQYFVANYGARVLSEPPASGLNWLVYVLPPFAFLLGIVLLFHGFRLWKRSSSTSPGTGIDNGDQITSPDIIREKMTTKDEDYLLRLEKELRERK